MDFLVWIISFGFLPPMALTVVAIVNNSDNSVISESGSKKSNRDLFTLLAVLSITLVAVIGLLGYFGKL